MTLWAQSWRQKCQKWRCNQVIVDVAATIFKGAKVMKRFPGTHQIKEDARYETLRAESI